MGKKELKYTDLKLFIGCQVQTNIRRETTSGEPLKKLKGTLMEIDLGMDNKAGILLEDETDKTHYVYLNPNEFKLLLRKKHTIKIEEFAEICKKIWGVDEVVFGLVNGFFAVTEKGDYEDEIEWSDEQIIINAEEADFDNVLAITKPNGEYSQLDLAYGTSDEIRYFVEIDVQAQFIDELCKMGFDVFDFIKNGLAEEKCYEHSEDLIIDFKGGEYCNKCHEKIK